MEAIMKDDHQNDHLEAAVQTPDGTFYKVIPSKFLWTSLPPPPGRYNLIFLYFMERCFSIANTSSAVFGEREDRSCNLIDRDLKN